MILYDEKIGLCKFRWEEGTLISFPSVQNPRMCRLSPPFFPKVIRNEFLVGLGKCFSRTSSRVPSFREIGKAREKQRGPWTIEGSLMYLMAREDGNSRVNVKWSNGKDKGRQRRWKQKWGATLAATRKRICQHMYASYLLTYLGWRCAEKWDWLYSCVRIFSNYKNTLDIFLLSAETWERPLFWDVYFN